MRLHATLIFTGRFVPSSFDEFLRHRAARLSIEAWPRRLEGGRIEVEVAGQADLVDMFEMACSLGPIDCLVLDVERLGA